MKFLEVISSWSGRAGKLRDLRFKLFLSRGGSIEGGFSGSGPWFNAEEEERFSG